MPEAYDNRVGSGDITDGSIVSKDLSMELQENMAVLILQQNADQVAVKRIAKEIYIPADEFSVTTGTSGEIDGTGTLGHSMDDGELSTMSYRPFEFFGLDKGKDTNVQVVWCGINGTTTQGVEWLVTYDQDVLESGVLGAPATALDTVIVEDPENDTAYTIQRTIAGVINANTLVENAAIAFRVEAQVVDSVNDPGCWFIGLLLTQQQDG